jgi:GNAT superfamily N-acetyltransferase
MTSHEPIVANFRGWFPLLDQLEGARLEHGDSYSRWTSAVRLPLFNGVLGFPEADSLEPAIDEVLAPFDEGDIPLLWIAPLTDAVSSHLEARGFDVESVPGMAIELSALPPSRVPAGSVIREVDDDVSALEVATRIALMTNGLPVEAVPPFIEALARFPERTRVRTFLATVDGAAASTCTLLDWAGVIGLYNVGTLEEFRGRGLGREVSLAALEAGRSTGHRLGVLQASSAGEPIYRRLGFEETCRFAFAVRDPA